MGKAVPPPVRPRLYHVAAHQLPPPERREDFLARIAAMGFDTLLLGWPFPVAGRSWFATLTLDRLAFPSGTESARDGLSRLAQAAAAHGLALHVDLVCTRAGDGDVHAALPGCWSAQGAPCDPRVSPAAAGHWPLLRDRAAAERFAAFWGRHLKTWRQAGVKGMRCHDAGVLPADVWRLILGEARAAGLVTLAWTPGQPRDTVRALADAFDFVTSSAAWWDGRASWLVEEYEGLRSHARLLAFPDDPFGPRLAARFPARETQARHRLMLAAAALLSDGWLMPMGFEFGASIPFMDSRQDAAMSEEEAVLDLSSAIAAVNAAPVEIDRLRQLTSSGAPVILVEAQGSGGAQLLAFNPDCARPVRLDLDAAAARLAMAPEGQGPEGQVLEGQVLEGEVLEGEVPDALPAGGVARVDLVPAAPVAAPRPAIAAATGAPRIAIEQVSPSADGGRFAVKRCVGDVVTVEADIFTDGHEQLAAEVRWRALDARGWNSTPMTLMGNDRWRASFPLRRVGGHTFLIEAWWDQFGTFRRDLRKKRDAGRPLEVEVQEGLAHLEAALDHATTDTAAVIRDHLRRITGADAASLDTLLAPALAAAMALAEPRAFAFGGDTHYPVDCDREAARHASWYELFPRSITDDASRHGTFRDVIARLPAIRDMGFDVLYFPPIHPIGRTHRKGRNNSLTAAPDDPGSPYAIGSQAGGHDAIHPELGTFEDFRALITAAREQGLEIALDFAIQCSPDHPWLKEHPDWFQWRPDGTIRYAENPPKTYEDIVNVDFYAPGAVPDLWIALRDVVEGWVRQGVRIFRVDNPHTKPFPFWEWLIADIRSRDPGVIFLAEAFTRPKVMYRLGKIGFSQSYTYFTWRNGKNEITDYLEELNRAPARDIFRPHFFVNTPDINPYFLQRSGRPGFLIRAALAATLSGLWGVYSGFELCEHESVPGKEEYLHSEKYEIKPRDYLAPGNIVAEITRLNAIRRAQPALQIHLGVTFYNAFDDQVLYFGKRLPQASDMVLVAVTLDPHAPHSPAIEVPLWEFGLPDHGAVEVEDLLRGHRFTWTGKLQSIHLDPADLPYAIWHIRPAGGMA